MTAQETSAVRLAASLSGEHVAHIVDALNEELTATAAAVLRRLNPALAVQVLDRPELDGAADLLAALPESDAARLIDGMSADRATDVFHDLSDAQRASLIRLVRPETAASLRRLIAYPEATAGAMMTEEFVSVPSTWTVAATLEHIRHTERSRETVYAIYVLHPDSRKLVGAVSLRRLLGGEPEDPVLSVAAGRAPVTTGPDTDREEVARLISRHDLLALPVIDELGHIIGIVTVDDVIDAIVAESTEDVQKFGGMEALGEPYMEIGFGHMLKKRAGWLCALFLSEMLTASAMQGFEGELEKAIVLTLFIPLIMSSGGNSGSQATSLLIRALALGQVRLRDWWKVALRELPTGIALGAILGVIGIARITLWQWFGLYDYGEHWMLVALTVGTALVGIVTFGSLSGSMLPFVLQRVGFDPASASAPFVATLVDVSGLVIYFSVASLILRGTLL